MGVGWEGGQRAEMGVEEGVEEAVNEDGGVEVSGVEVVTNGEKNLFGEAGK